MSPLPVIPQIVGPAPPCYPGNKPDETADDETVRTWTLRAKLFVKFYSYLFLPWDHNLDPRDPTMPDLQVLPWDDNTTWDNFCTIIKSWKYQSAEERDTNMWYKRSTYRILNNMVSNLRQSGSERTLLTKWRAIAADKKEDSGYEAEQTTTKQSLSGAPADVVITTNDVADDVALLEELLRNQFGVNDKLTFKQKQNRQKTNEYINRQLTSLNYIYTAHVINVDQSDVSESIEVSIQDIPLSSLQPYLSYTLEECVAMRKRILSNVQPVSPVEIGNADKLSGVPVDNTDESTGIDQKEEVILRKPIEINLSPAQIKIVGELKDCIERVSYLDICKDLLELGKLLQLKRWKRL